MRIFALIGFFWIYSCKPVSHTPKPIEAKRIEIDLTEHRIVSFGDLFAEVRYIPLAFNEDNAIQNVHKILVAPDGGLIVFDKQLNRVFGFESNGAARFTIRNQGKGPEEYVNIEDVAIDAQNHYIHLLDMNSQAILTYDLTGKFIRKKSISDAQKSGLSFHIYKDEMYFDRAHYPIDGHHLGQFDAKTYEFKQSFLPLSDFEVRWGESNTNIFDSYQDTTYFIAPMEYAVFAKPYGEDPFALLEFDFLTHHPVLNDFNQKQLKDVSQSHRYFVENQWVYGLGNLNVVGQHVYFNLMKNGREFCIVDKVSGKVRSFIQVKEEDPLKMWSGNIVGSNDKELIGVINETERKEKLAELSDLEIDSEYSNPVLAFYTIK
jgi:hypothetical protein